ncbi:MAG: NifB/NifX family molybdenum-iron cluster-binding protein [bacterium]
MAKRIAITVTQTDGIDSSMDPRFGRTPAFVFVDEDTGEVVGEKVNTAAAHGHGAGTAAAAAMAKQGVGAVISGRFGPKAYEALAALGVEMWVASPGLTARQALDRYLAGGLRRMRVEVFR